MCVPDKTQGSKIIQGPPTTDHSSPITRLRFAPWQTYDASVRNDARFSVNFFNFHCSLAHIPAVEKQYVAVPDGV